MGDRERTGAHRQEGSARLLSLCRATWATSRATDEWGGCSGRQPGGLSVVLRLGRQR